ncbi:MAG: aldolase/citrate lyase family protein [Geminicoccaceae bacterium]
MGGADALRAGARRARAPAPHEDEQPFTRPLGGVAIPPGTDEVLVQAEDSVHGLGPDPRRASRPVDDEHPCRPGPLTDRPGPKAAHRPLGRDADDHECSETPRAGREPAWQAWLGLADAAVAELMAHAGYDFLILDQEHGPGSLETAADVMRAAEAAGCPLVVRVP